MKKKFTVKIRIPEYVENFKLVLDGKEVAYDIINGYAIIETVFCENTPIFMDYENAIRRIYANPKVDENHGKVAIMNGPFVMCAEGIDNEGNVDIEIADDPQLMKKGDKVYGKSAQGKEFCLIPYYQWCNRGTGETDSKMTVWLKQENMSDLNVLEKKIEGKLYDIYE